MGFRYVKRGDTFVSQDGEHVLIENVTKDEPMRNGFRRLSFISKNVELSTTCTDEQLLFFDDIVCKDAPVNGRFESLARNAIFALIEKYPKSYGVDFIALSKNSEGVFCLYIGTRVYTDANLIPEEVKLYGKEFDEQVDWQEGAGIVFPIDGEIVEPMWVDKLDNRYLRELRIKSASAIIVNPAGNICHVLSRHLLVHVCDVNGKNEDIINYLNGVYYFGCQKWSELETTLSSSVFISNEGYKAIISHHH